MKILSVGKKTMQTDWVPTTHGLRIISCMLVLSQKANHTLNLKTTGDDLPLFDKRHHISAKMEMLIPRLPEPPLLWGSGLGSKDQADERVSGIPYLNPGEVSLVDHPRMSLMYPEDGRFRSKRVGSL
jgi:hypothetical protein